MDINKKVEKLIARGIKKIEMSKEEYTSLKEETKNLIKLNNVVVANIETTRKGDNNGNT